MRIHQAVVVGSSWAARKLREAGIDVVALDDVASQQFVGADDLWTITTSTGLTHTGRVVISAVNHPPLPSIPAVEGPVKAYLGVAAHGLPNYFMVEDAAQAQYIVTVIQSMIRGESTRVEVKSHVQAEFNRGMHCNPDLRDFEFTTMEDRDDDDENEFHGPAVLIDADGIEYPVAAHLLAQYEPIDNAVRWSGRIEPCAALARLHTTTNTAVRFRIGENPAVKALLTDSDTWGGSHIVGHGTSPYPIYASA